MDEVGDQAVVSQGQDAWEPVIPAAEPAEELVEKPVLEEAHLKDGAGGSAEVRADLEPQDPIAEGTDGVAAVNIDLSSGGRWYGGAHMLRQLWPIDRAQFEVGPYYPFDHGPNGLGSVVGAIQISLPQDQDGTESDHRLQERHAERSGRGQREEGRAHKREGRENAGHHQERGP